MPPQQPDSAQPLPHPSGNEPAPVLEYGIPGHARPRISKLAMASVIVASPVGLITLLPLLGLEGTLSAMLPIRIYVLLGVMSPVAGALGLAALVHIECSNNTRRGRLLAIFSLGMSAAPWLLLAILIVATGGIL